MIVNSLTGQVMDNFDPELGKVENKNIPITIQWVETEKAYYEEEVTTFPNGGINVRQVLVSPAQGHWKVNTEDGSDFPYDYDVSDGFPKDQIMHDVVSIAYYTPYSEEEKSDIAARKEKAAKLGQIIDELPETQTSTDEAICQLYEDSLIHKETADSQDAAICEIYEMLLGE